MEIGDIVILKSGGPRMTITEKVGGNLRCTWMDQFTTHEAHFPAAAVRFVQVADSAPIGK